MTLIDIIIAVFLPPLSVAMKKGVSRALLINIILTISGFVPGIIHAIYVSTRDENLVLENNH